MWEREPAVRFIAEALSRDDPVIQFPALLSVATWMVGAHVQLQKAGGSSEASSSDVLKARRQISAARHFPSSSRAAWAWKARADA